MLLIRAVMAKKQCATAPQSPISPPKSAKKIDGRMQRGEQAVTKPGKREIHKSFIHNVLRHYSGGVISVETTLSILKAFLLTPDKPLLNCDEVGRRECAAQVTAVKQRQCSRETNEETLMIANRCELSSKPARFFALSARRANSFAATSGAPRARIAMTADSGRVSADCSGRLAAALAAESRSNLSEFASAMGFDGTRLGMPSRRSEIAC